MTFNLQIECRLADRQKSFRCTYAVFYHYDAYNYVLRFLCCVL